MSDDFYKPVSSAYALKADKDIERERGIRLYCVSHNQTWALQVRAPVQLRRAREGADFMIAVANLGVDEMRALRGAIDAALAEVVP